MMAFVTIQIQSLTGKNIVLVYFQLKYLHCTPLVIGAEQFVTCCKQWIEEMRDSFILLTLSSSAQWFRDLVWRPEFQRCF
jgi:hypothetical protein